MLATIVHQLYEVKPSQILYHYADYQALLSISHSAELWATDIHYFNDSSELHYAVQLFVSALDDAATESPYPAELIQQLRDWLRQRLADGHMLFVACFSEDGNLLSQWRGYTPHGNGVSLGFDPEFLAECARSHGFRFGQCIYDLVSQRTVARQAIDALLASARAIGPAKENESHPSQSYFPRFYAQEEDLLSIAALLKHPAFIAEREWRAVSSVSPNYVEYPPKYRAGRTTLIPYRTFSLRVGAESSLRLARMYLGPTPENNLAMSALSKFLASNGIRPRDGLLASQLPYREI